MLCGNYVPSVPSTVDDGPMYLATALTGAGGYSSAQSNDLR